MLEQHEAEMGASRYEPTRTSPREREREKERERVGGEKEKAREISASACAEVTLYAPSQDGLLMRIGILAIVSEYWILHFRCWLFLAVMPYSCNERINNWKIELNIKGTSSYFITSVICIYIYIYIYNTLNIIYI